MPQRFEHLLELLALLRIDDSASSAQVVTGADSLDALGWHGQGVVAD